MINTISICREQRSEWHVIVRSETKLAGFDHCAFRAVVAISAVAVLRRRSAARWT
jgi:hypothetical protein